MGGGSKKTLGEFGRVRGTRYEGGLGEVPGRAIRQGAGEAAGKPECAGPQASCCQGQMGLGKPPAGPGHGVGAEPEGGGQGGRAEVERAEGVEGAERAGGACKFQTACSYQQLARRICS